MISVEFLANKYKLNLDLPNPVYIPEGGRKELVELWRELGYKTGVEVGVQRADFGEQICKGIPGLKYYGVDSWTQYAGYRDINASHEGQGAFDELYEMAKKRLVGFDATLIRNWSVEAAKEFVDKSLDFVYIDGNHDFEHTTADIASWLPKVKIGGMICGHDYARINRNMLKIHCKDVVDGWVAAHGIHPLFVFSKDNSPNWLWFKEK